MQEEQWKNIKGLEGYAISSLGRIKNVKTDKILKQFNHRGYRGVSLRLNRKKVTKKVHRLVAEEFIRSLAPTDHIDHINRVKHDNRLSNLRVATVAQNMANKGINLTDIRRIVELHKKGLKIEEVWGEFAKELD